MNVPIPVLVAIVLLIAFLLFLLRRRSNRTMLDQQRHDSGMASPTASRRSRASRLTRHDMQHLLEEPDIAKAIAAGRKIEAIKLVRARTGLGLEEAKDLVERG
jgi:ribosomal protein L7/L12